MAAWSQGLVTPSFTPSRWPCLLVTKHRAVVRPTGWFLKWQLYCEIIHISYKPSIFFFKVLILIPVCYSSSMLKGRIQWFFSIFTELHHHHHYLILEHFRHPRTKLRTHKQSLPTSWQPLLSTNNHKSTVCLSSRSYLDISCPQTRTRGGLLWMASFTYQSWCFHGSSLVACFSTSPTSMTESYSIVRIYHMVPLVLNHFYDPKETDQGRMPGSRSHRFVGNSDTGFVICSNLFRGFLVFCGFF